MLSNIKLIWSKIGILMSGTVLSQLVPLLIMPILTRIYTPEQFGLVANYLAMATFLSMLTMGRLETAIVLPQSDIVSNRVKNLCLFLSTLSLLVILFLCVVFSHNISELIGKEGVYLLPVFTFCYSMYQVINYSLMRQKNYKALAKLKIILSIVLVSFQFLFSYFDIGLLLALTFSYLSILVFDFIFKTNIFKFGNFKFFRFSKLKRMTKTLFEYKSIPLYTAPASLIDSGRNLSVNYLIANGFGNALLGQYSLSLRILQGPIQLVNAVLGQVFFSEVSRVEREKVYPILCKSVVFLALLGIVPFLLIYFYAVDFFVLIFGVEWRVAGEIAISLTPWLYFNFVSSPISSVFLIINKQKVSFYFSCSYFITAASSIYFARGEIVETLSFFSYSMSLLLLVYITLALLFSRNYSNCESFNYT
ncbi:lipopolysaccharide biosynthesis protein [Brumimicrobium sp.]|uniref:lipopolysaccharide biosynthesis protein n=1 Tax=Brumimicrobium sp. TaxID=2029867 RepID=UPI003A9090FC